jgi:hypothetical protein
LLPELTESDPDKLKKLEKWKGTLTDRHTVYLFKDSNDLSLQVAADLSREIRQFEETTVARGAGPDAGIQVQTGRVQQSETHLKLRFCQRFGDEQWQLLHSLAMDVDGNVVIAGDFWGGVNFGGSLLRSSGDRDIFLAKFDRNGRYQWSQRFGDPAEQVAVGVQVDSTGAIFIAGAFTGTLDFGGTPLVSKGRYSIALAKFDPDGRHLWSRSFGDEGYYVPECLAVTANGQAVVAGRFVGSLDFGGGKIACESAQTDIFVAAVSPNGDYIWARRFGGPYEQQTRSIAVDSSGRIALTGVFKGSISFDECKLSEDRPGEYCGFLANLDEHGKTIWCKRLGDPFAEQGSVVSFDQANGDIIAAGFIRNKLPPQVSGQFESLCSLARYDASGILQWSKTFGVSAFPDSISVIPCGDILLTGHFRLTVDFGLGPLVSEGGYDIFAAMFSSDGAPLWSARFGDARQQFLVQDSVSPV